MTICVGLDWSITGPAMTTFDGESYRFYAIRGKKKQDSFNPALTLFDYPDWKTPQERYDRLTKLYMDVLLDNHVDKVFIESYSFASTGQIFNIAECTSVMKHKIFKEIGIDVILKEPTVVKKFATDKGNSKKRQMVDAFKRDVGDPYEWVGISDDGKEKIPNPISDFVDSYYVLRCGLNDN